MGNNKSILVPVSQPLPRTSVLRTFPPFQLPPTRLGLGISAQLLDKPLHVTDKIKDQKKIVAIIYGTSGRLFFIVNNRNAPVKHFATLQINSIAKAAGLLCCTSERLHVISHPVSPYSFPLLCQTPPPNQPKLPKCLPQPLSALRRQIQQSQRSPPLQPRLVGLMNSTLCVEKTSFETLPPTTPHIPSSRKLFPHTLNPSMPYLRMAACLPTHCETSAQKHTWTGTRELGLPAGTSYMSASRKSS